MKEWYFEGLYVDVPSGYMTHIAVVITLGFNTLDNSLRQKWAKKNLDTYKLHVLSCTAH